MTSIQLHPARRDEQPIVNHLMQFYLYDFTEFDGADTDDLGRFDYGSDLTEYWVWRGRWPYLARVDGTLAGFALVSDRLERQTGMGRYVVEFFIMRKYRRRGIGREIAFQMFDTFRGHWEVAEIGSNLPAQAFWRKVIGEYTSGHYREFTTRDGPTPVIWQVFDSSAS